MVDVRYVGAGLVVALALASTAFAVAPSGGENLAPVPFDQTLSTGLTGVDVQQARAAGYVIPQGEVFYSQYEYVVGYYGVEALASGIADAEAGGYFGQPLAVFVTDFEGSEPTLTDEGFVRVASSTQVGWTRVGDAHFVVDSGARTPGGPTVLPFSSRSTAEAFASRHGGEVVDWESVRAQFASGGDDAAERLRERRERHTARADAVVDATRDLRSRPVSTVVGEDAATLRAAVEQAPPETTVELPPGTYEGNLTVDESLTIRGAGSSTVVRGDGNGTVLTIESSEAAITSLHVEGAGDRPVGSARNATGEEWDERIQLVYGRGDAAIRLADAHGTLVEDVTVDTPSNGIAALNSSGAVVRNVTVRGNDDVWDGAMGVLAMYSELVVEDSTIVGGRDGVYTHHSHGVVIRNNTMRDQRFGVHEMFTSNSFVSANAIRQTDVGIIIMTRPAGNVIVGNDVRDSDQGIATSGSGSFAAENVLVSNDIGLSIGTDRSYYTRNAIVGNDVGVRSSTLLPTNDVVANDVVGNERFVSTGSGVQNVWAADGRGNYWGEIPGVDRDGDGVIDRAFRPGSRLDAGATESAGASSLARSPAVGAIRQFQSQIPGLRGSSVIDPAPLSRPARPDVLERLETELEGDP